MKQNWISHVVSSFGNDILYKIRISPRFGIENYAGKVGIIQKIFVNIVIFFVCDFLCQTVLIPPDKTVNTLCPKSADSYC